MKVRFIEIGSIEEAASEMERIGVDPAGIALMAPKQFHYNLKLDRLTPAQANIIKQDMLSIGGEAAVSKGVAACEVAHTGCILSATLKQFARLAEKLCRQPYGLAGIAGAINEAIGNLTSGRLTFKGRTRQWDLSGRVLVMGILNVTPDSFYDGGRFFDRERAVERALKMAGEGADVIDVGGESTRPGSKGVGSDEELRRVIPVVEELAKRGIAVSVDTTKAVIAEEALKNGAEIINDISAMTLDASMAEVVSKYGSGVILMHMRGTPADMRGHASYGDLMGEIFDYLAGRLAYARKTGIEMDKTAIDPGIGFAKSAGDNLKIIKRVREFKTLGRPIVLGASRKSFIGAALGAAPEQRLGATIAAESLGVFNGARILRAHDVKEARSAADMISAITAGALPSTTAVVQPASPVNQPASPEEERGKGRV
ncbi:MAG: dihydropteroate synthase [Deltaproteobacteria bacterium]|nr:dihydropteroate synthase [Deltaproteobacteria bacterium]